MESQMESVKIYGLSGKMGTGKKYVASLMKNLINSDSDSDPESEVIELDFARQLKLDAAVFNNLKFEDVFSKNGKIRKLLQTFGAKIKNNCGKNIWIRYLDIKLKIMIEQGFKNFIVTDVRFKDEAEYIKSLGGILIRIESPQRNLKKIQEEGSDGEHNSENNEDHISETDLDTYEKFDHKFYNDGEIESEKISCLKKIMGVVDEKKNDFF